MKGQRSVVAPASLRQSVMEYRALSGVTEAELARAAGISRPTFRRIMAGRPVRASSLIAVARALDDGSAKRLLRKLIEDDHLVTNE